MPSPPVSPTILKDDGETNEAPHCSPSDADDPLVELDDFLDVVQNLPLHLDKTSRCYYIRGKITKNDQERFYKSAKRIGTLTLGQPGSKFGAKGTISPQVFVRLAQLQGVNGFLLPSLRRLQISTSDGPYLDHLDLFHSPSLKSLEISEPTDIGHSSSISWFLDNTTEVSQDLESLILGPLELNLPQKLLDSCGRFRELRRLELRGVSFSTTLDTILGDIGSLEHLKEFVLEERKELVNKPATSEDAAAPAIRNTLNTAPHDSSWGFGSNFETPSLSEPPPAESWTGSGRGLFDGFGSTIPDRQPHSSPIEPPTRTSTMLPSGPVDGLRKLNVVNPPVSDKQPSSSPIEPPISSSSGLRTDLFPSLKTLYIVGTSDLIEKVIGSVTSPDLYELSISFTTITRKMQALKRKKTMTKSTVLILNSAIERWASLISVAVTANTSVTASLPNDVLRNLLLQPKLKRLEINGFDISFTDSVLCELNGEAYFPQLETLHLPVKNSVALSRLRQIAMAWPNLTSLRCKIDLAGLAEQPMTTVMDPLSHGLKSLIVANDQSSPGPAQQLESWKLLKIAAYIDCLFPDLKEMEAVVGDFGQQHFHPEWVPVFHMVKLLQTVRACDRQRFMP